MRALDILGHNDDLATAWVKRAHCCMPNSSSDTEKKIDIVFEFVTARCSLSQIDLSHSANPSNLSVVSDYRPKSTENGGSHHVVILSQVHCYGERALYNAVQFSRYRFVDRGLSGLRNAAITACATAEKMASAS